LKLAEHITSLKHLDCAAPDWAYLETAALSILGINENDLDEVITKITESL